MPKRLNLAGRQFGRLRVLSFSHIEKRTARWLCLCSCGKETTLCGSYLIRGITRSCGCLVRETTKRISTKHGHAPRAKPSPEYICWAAMIRRCFNPNNKSFKDYGARGITVCKQWRGHFEAFLADMGAKPPGTSIHRIENDGNYEPDNCIWATRETHESNKRKPAPRTIVIIDGAPYSIKQAAKAYGFSASGVRNRMRSFNETPKQAISAMREYALTGISVGKGVVAFGIRYKSRRAVARAHSIDPTSIAYRVNRFGETIEQAVSALLKRKGIPIAQLAGWLP